MSFDVLFSLEVWGISELRLGKSYMPPGPGEALMSEG
jgi:hypothetical protein